MTPAGTSNELDVQNGWEENTHTHTRNCTSGSSQMTAYVIAFVTHGFGMIVISPLTSRGITCEEVICSSEQEACIHRHDARVICGLCVVVFDSHIQRIVLATEETAVTQ